MKIKVLGLLLGAISIGLHPTRADEKLATLRVGAETYTNVVVTTVTPTDIYFTHASGMGNAKLKNLPPDVRGRFGFDPVRSQAAEQKQTEATTRFYMVTAAQAKERKETIPKPAEPSSAKSPDPVAPQLHAKSFRGQPAPQFLVEKWITPKPTMAGKFVLLDFWATWCPPCRRSIPQLNELQEKFKAQLVVVGLSDESEADIRRMIEPKINYAVATDTSARTKREVKVTGIPHAMLIDPKGVVRFEGMPHYLTEKSMKLLIDRYGD